MSKKEQKTGAPTPGINESSKEMNSNISILHPDKISLQDNGMVVLIRENIPHVYWLCLYRDLGLNPSHAEDIINRLVPGKHYLRFTRNEIKPLLDSIAAAAIPAVKAYYFLTAEGWNRALMEIDTNPMLNREAAEYIEATKNKMADIFARYNRGEVLSIALDKTNLETPVLTGKASAIVSDCFEIADAIQSHFGIDKSIATVHLLNGYKPEMIQAGHSGNIEPIVQLLPITANEDEAYLTATAIGDIVGLGNRTVNKTLKEWGYHIEKIRISSSGKVKPDGWKPTMKGFPEGGWKLNSDGHNGGKLYVGVQWRWKPSILKVFEERMGLTLNHRQSKLVDEESS